jgi:hypothetical protein
MRRIANALAGLTFSLIAGPVMAADAIEDYSYAPSYCTGYEATSLLGEQNLAELKGEVSRLMDEAIAVSHDQQWVYSGRPVYVWATEATYSCGKAYGYLKTSYRDEQNLNNCGCAYSRMQSYMH